jgi:hypothetical protein
MEGTATMVATPQVTVVGCPFCTCGDACGKEAALIASSTKRRLAVLNAVQDLYSMNRAILDLDVLYIAQELLHFGFFPDSDPPKLVDVGHAVDLIREVER